MDINTFAKASVYAIWFLGAAAAVLGLMWCCAKLAWRLYRERVGYSVIVQAMREHRQREEEKRGPG